MVVEEEVRGDAVGGVLEGSSSCAGYDTADDECGEVFGQGLRDEEYREEYICRLKKC